MSWYSEQKRHELASKGIKTKEPINDKLVYVLGVPIRQIVERDYNNEIRSIERRYTDPKYGDLIVDLYRIIGTDSWVVNVHEPTMFGVYDERAHSSIGTFNGQTNKYGNWWGRVGTSRLPTIINAIPASQERIDTVHRYQDSQYKKAYDIIETAFPELIKETPTYKDMGSISYHAINVEKIANR